MNRLLKHRVFSHITQEKQRNEYADSIYFTNGSKTRSGHSCRLLRNISYENKKDTSAAANLNLASSISFCIPLPETHIDCKRKLLI